MKKLTYALAAAATLAIGAPTIANAAGVGVYVGGSQPIMATAMMGPAFDFTITTGAGIVVGIIMTATMTATL